MEVLELVDVGPGIMETAVSEETNSCRVVLEEDQRPRADGVDTAFAAAVEGLLPVTIMVEAQATRLLGLLMEVAAG